MNYSLNALKPVTPATPEEKHRKRTFQGIPSIACSPEGRLFAVWYAGGDSECRDNFVLLSCSDDTGKSWRHVAVVDPPDTDVRAFDSVLWFSPDGLLRWFWAQGCGGPSGTWDIQDGAGGVFESIISHYDDCPGRFAFSAPRRISDGVMMNKPSVFSNGTWVYPVCVWSIATIAHPDRKIVPGCRMAVSSDMGRTLTVRGAADFTAMPCGADETEEQNFVERPDGSIVLWGRARQGIAESISIDGGVTWTQPRFPTGFATTNARICVRRLPSGRLLMICNDTGGIIPPPYAQRRKLTARLSDDHGVTWNRGLLLDGRDNVSYPDADIMPDGSLCVIYDHERLAQGDILMAKITEADIEAGSLVSPGSFLARTIDHSGGVSGK